MNARAATADLAGVLNVVDHQRAGVKKLNRLAKVLALDKSFVGFEAFRLDQFESQLDQAGADSFGGTAQQVSHGTLQKADEQVRDVPAVTKRKNLIEFF